MRIENYEGSWESYSEETESRGIDFNYIDSQDDLAYSVENTDEYDCF